MTSCLTNLRIDVMSHRCAHLFHKDVEDFQTHWPEAHIPEL